MNSRMKILLSQLGITLTNAELTKFTYSADRGDGLFAKSDEIQAYLAKRRGNNEPTDNEPTDPAEFFRWLLTQHIAMREINEEYSYDLHILDWLEEHGYIKTPFRIGKLNELAKLSLNVALSKIYDNLNKIRENQQSKVIKEEAAPKSNEAFTLPLQEEEGETVKLKTKNNNPNNIKEKRFKESDLVTEDQVINFLGNELSRDLSKDDADTYMSVASKWKDNPKVETEFDRLKNNKNNNFYFAANASSDVAAIILSSRFYQYLNEVQIKDIYFKYIANKAFKDKQINLTGRVKEILVDACATMICELSASGYYDNMVMSRTYKGPNKYNIDYRKAIESQLKDHGFTLLDIQNSTSAWKIISQSEGIKLSEILYDTTKDNQNDRFFNQNNRDDNKKNNKYENNEDNIKVNDESQLQAYARKTANDHFANGKQDFTSLLGLSSAKNHKEQFIELVPTQG